MTAGDLALVLAVILCAFGFAALVVVLARVLSALGALRDEIDALRRQTTPLIDDLRESADTARDVVLDAQRDLRRFDRVLGSAEAISGAVSGSGRVARTALSRPVIRIVAVSTGVKRMAKRLRVGPKRTKRRDLRLVESPERRRA